MESAYKPELWRDLYVMLGTSSAALFGLLLVVTSLHLDEVMNNQFYRARARNNSYYLIGLLIEAVLISDPATDGGAWQRVGRPECLGVAVSPRQYLQILL